MYRTATLDMIFVASCAPAVNAKVGTRVRQHALPIPRRYVCLESLGPQTLYVLTCLCPLPEIPACTVAPPGFMSAADNPVWLKAIVLAGIHGVMKSVWLYTVVLSVGKMIRLGCS